MAPEPEGASKSTSAQGGQKGSHHCCFHKHIRPVTPKKTMILAWSYRLSTEGRIPSVPVMTTATKLPIQFPSPSQPVYGNKALSLKGQPILALTEHWLAALLIKHLQTAWDLVSQTRLWIRVSKALHTENDKGSWRSKEITGRQ